MSIDTNRIIEGDSLVELDSLPDESIHAIVTDPPYGLAFMGRSWDDFEPREYQEWCEEWATKALRVLKPGGHLLAFSGNRTHHRLFTGVEDAGFVVRDTLTWHYGSGFPKGQDLGKLIDKQAYKHRHDIREFGDYLKQFREEKGLSKAEIDRRLGLNTAYSWWEGRKDGIQLPDWEHYIELKDILGLDDRFDELMRKESDERKVIGKHPCPASEIYRDKKSRDVDITEPASETSEQWDGWSTQLKPSTEFVVMARKPLSEGTMAENVLEHGTAALNIDECRIPMDGEMTFRTTSYREAQSGEFSRQGETNHTTGEKTVEGRYPANLLLDDVAAAQLDEQTGELESGRLTQEVANNSDSTPGTNCYGEFTGRGLEQDYEANSGGASRFFYCAKATKSERTLDGRIDNAHPTVKPIDLMEWLVKLVTAEGQIVLDPFCGSGTTLRAAKNLGQEFVGIEQQAKWCDVARARCGLTPENPEVLTSENQSALSSYGES